MLTPLMLGAELESEVFYSGAPRALSGFGWVLLGYALWSGVGEGVRRSAPARYLFVDTRTRSGYKLG
jgi:hypothetical protein